MSMMHKVLKFGVAMEAKREGAILMGKGGGVLLCNTALLGPAQYFIGYLFSLYFAVLLVL